MDLPIWMQQDLPDLGEPGPSISKEKEKRLTSRPSECEICHRPASHYHCGVASCKACKTFFRRIFVSNSNLRCKFENNCFKSTNPTEIRLRCQSCRYQKCVKVGMDPTILELKDDEKEVANFKKVMRKSDIELPNLNLQVVPLKEKLSIAQKTIEMLIYLDLRMEKFRMSAYNPSFLEYGSLEDMIGREAQIGIADRFGTMPNWPIPKEKQIYGVLPTVSRIRFLPDTNALKYFPSLKVWVFFNIFVAIEYAKTFPFFQNLEISDKKLLLGHAALVLANLHNAYFAYSKKLDGCFHPDGTERPLKDEVLYKSAVYSLPAIIRSQIQPTEYLLLKTLCLCNPNIPGLTEHAQKILSKERENLAEILLNQCLQNSQKGGPSRFCEILGIISVLEVQQRRQKDEHVAFVAPVLASWKTVHRFLDDIMGSE